MAFGAQRENVSCLSTALAVVLVSACGPSGSKQAEVGLLSQTAAAGLSLRAGFPVSAEASNGPATTGAYSVAAGDVVLAFVGTDAVAGVGSFSVDNPTISGGTLDWTRITSIENSANGAVAIFRGTPSGAVSGVTTMVSGTGGSQAYISVIAIAGARGALGAVRTAGGSGSAAAVTLSATTAGSWIFAIGEDWNSTTARALSGTTTPSLLHEQPDPAMNDYWVERAITAAPGSFTIGTSAPATENWNMAAVEVLAAGGDGCGNSVIDSGEACDGSSLNGQTCVTQGFSGGGTLACNSSCTGFVTSGCISALCGDNTIQGSEPCDGTNLHGRSCPTEGFFSGTLVCNSSCSGFVTTGCTNCGNDSIQSGEVCDGTNLNGHSCVTQGYAGGTLACNATCTGFVTSSCTATAATPTFSPPAGTYSSAQIVTMTSTTPSATIHCTNDGSTPTAGSPVCSGPVTVSATTTLKAIATANGLANSSVATATYTISSSPSLLTELQTLSSRRFLFAHQSVGNNILNGHSGNGGLNRIFHDNPTGGMAVVYDPPSAAPSDFPLGGFADTAAGTNGDPAGKIDDFDRQVRQRFSGALDYYAFKFCFADIGESADITSLWAHYQLVMDALERDFPGRIIHWTVPIMPDVTDIDGNTRREQLSSYIRTKYGPTKRVFDLADREAHDAEGNLVQLGGVRALAKCWSADGAYDGHLNDTGANMIARAYIDFLYRVVVP